MDDNFTLLHRDWSTTSLCDRIFRLLHTAVPFDALNEGYLHELSGFIFGVEILEWLGYNVMKLAVVGHNTST